MNNSTDERRDEKPAIEIPHDVVNEQILIAAILVDEQARAKLLPSLSPDLFVEPVHVSIWAAARGMLQRGIDWSAATLHQQVAHDVELAYLESLQRSYPEPPANLSHHVAALRWDSVRAETVKGPLADLLKALRDPLTPAERVRAVARRISTTLDQNVDRRFMKDPVLLAKEHVNSMRRRACWPYGIEGLDMFEDGSYRMIPGAAPGKTTALTAVSGAGKSVIAARIALEQARMGRPVLYGAWEMESGPTLELLTTMSLGWSRYAVSTGQLTADELNMFEERAALIGSYIRFFDAPFAGRMKRYDNDAAIDELHRCIADSGAAVVVLDLLERMIVDNRPEQERLAMFRIQEVFKQTGCHGVLVCQQKLKEIENRLDKRPTRSTILGSQAWVDISDTIIGLHRPGQWKPVEDDVMHVLIMKQRFGRWPLDVEGDWDGDRCTLTNCRTIEHEAVGKGSSFADEFLGADRKRR